MFNLCRRSKIFSHVSSISDMTHFQLDLNKFSFWCSQNYLSLNVDKCKHVSYYRNKPVFTSHYRLNNCRLDTLIEIRDLGVQFSRNLSFNSHIKIIVAKAYSMLGFLKRVCRRFNNVDALIAVYCAHVRSHLEYAAVVWSPYYSVYSCSIESIQKKFVLFALRRRYPRHLYLELPSYLFRCDILNLSTLSLRRKLFCIRFIYDVLSNRIDSLFILSEINFVVPSRRLRSNNTLFKIPFIRTNFGISDPLFVMFSLCNSISNGIGNNLDLSL